MAVWTCGSRSCPGHSDPSHRCATGAWPCGRKQPACPTHSHPSDRCAPAAGAVWTCGARDCPGHSASTHECSPGVWRCSRLTPNCMGHSQRSHACRADLSYSQQDCDASFTTAHPPGSPVTTCDVNDRVRLVQLVEVVTHRGSTSHRTPSARRQYINLDANIDPAVAHPEYGRAIRLQARVEWVSGDRSRPLAGHPIYWYSQAAAGNKAGLATREQESFDASGGGHARKQTSTDAMGWTPVVEFHLSLYGGDQFDVFATEAASYTGGLQAGRYTVWKKLWYQVTEMRDSAGGTFDVPSGVTTVFEAGYATVFIEFTEQTPRTSAAWVCNLPDGAARAAAARPHFRVDHLAPFKAHIMTVDWSEASPVERTVTATLTSPHWAAPNYWTLWKCGAALAWKVSAEWRPAAAAAWTCRRVRPACPTHRASTDRCAHAAGYAWSCGARGCPTHADPTDVCSGRPFTCRRIHPPCATHRGQNDQCPGVAGAVWTCLASHCPGHSRPSDVCGNPRQWLAIPDAAIGASAHPTQPGFKQITLNFSAGPVTPSAANPVEIKVVARIVEAAALGWGGGSHHLFLCTGMLRDRLPAADWVPTQRSDAVHEIGHALGLVNSPPTAAGAHNAWEDTAHAHHCTQPPTVCAMWWLSSTTRLTTFHLSGGTGCHDHLRRQDLSRAVMAGHWRD